MTLRLVFVRHGETQWNRESRSQGQIDTPLNPLGCRQAELVAGRLRDEKLLAVYTSPLRRARETAERIASFHGLEVIPCSELMELNHGDLEGMTGEEIRRHHGEFLEAWLAAPAGLRLPNGESLEELQERTWRFVENVRAAHQEGTVAAVSHNLALRTILCRVLGMDLNNLRRVRQDVACVNIVEFGQDRVQLVLMNSTCHLRSLDDDPEKGA